MHYSSCICSWTVSKWHLSHLCSFREYILAFLSWISWDFSEFAAVLSIYSSCSQCLCPGWDQIRTKCFVFFPFGGCCRSYRWETTAPVSLIFTRRVEKWTETSCLWAWRLQSKPTDSFIAVRAARQEEETTCGVFSEGGFNLVVSWSLEHGPAAAAAALNTAAAVTGRTATVWLMTRWSTPPGAWILIGQASYE